MSRTWALVCTALLSSTAAAEPPTGEVHAGLRVFSEPARSQPVVVVTPNISGRVDARRWLSISVDWASDVVTGATPRTYGSVDAVTAATQFRDVRNQVGAKVELRRSVYSGWLGYQFSTENDYRSHVLALGGQVDLFQRNTTLAVTYAHNFDSVCDLDNRGLAPTLRQPLGTSEGCFSGHVGLVDESLGIDGTELTLTQVLSQRLWGSVFGFYEHLAGFQSNPYRRVRLNGGRIEAQEAHPSTRDRGSVGARLRYAVPGLRAALGLEGRFYSDTWAIRSGTVRVAWDQLHLDDRLRWSLGLRYYQQGRAFFYRDAGEASSYENAGPPGQYFTGDREMAPFADLLLQGSIGVRSRPWSGRRLVRIFRTFEASLHADLMKVFALTPAPPNVARMSGVVDALSVGLSFTGEL